MMHPLVLRPVLALVQTEVGEANHGWRDVLSRITNLYRKILNLPEQGSTMAPAIDFLHFLEFTMMGIVAVLIALAGLYFIVRYRRRPGDGPTPRFAPPIAVELGVYIALFSTFVMFWVIGFRQYNGLLIAPPGAIDVYVMSKQWMWKFSYPDGPATVGVLYVPVGVPVRLHITSRDVIHSFYVPEFRLKRDAVPGMYTYSWFQANKTGVYPIYCAEFCGTDHSRMRSSVVVLNPADFADLQRGRPPTAWEEPGRVPPEVAEATGLERQMRMAELGLAVAARQGCLKCHSVDGSPLIGPTWFNLFGAFETMADGSLVAVNEAYITKYIMDPNFKRVAGFEPIMPSFMGLITPGEIAAIIEYMKSISLEPEQRHGQPAFTGPKQLPPHPQPGSDTLPKR